MSKAKDKDLPGDGVAQFSEAWGACLEEPIAAAARRSFQRLLDWLPQYIPADSPVRVESLFTAKARRARSFESECRRLEEAACRKYVVVVFNSLPEQLRRDLIDDESTKDSVIIAICAEILEHLVPRLESMANPGDDLAIFAEVRTRFKEYFDEAVALEIETAVSPFEDHFGALAMLGLIVQAKRMHADGNINEAWTNLLDASFFAGAQKGARLLRVLGRSAFPKRLAAARHEARRKAAQPIEARIGELFRECAPDGGWKTGKHAAKVIEAHLDAASRELISHKRLMAICARLKRQARSGALRA